MRQDPCVIVNQAGHFFAYWGNPSIGIGVLMPTLYMTLYRSEVQHWNNDQETVVLQCIQGQLHLYGASPVQYRRRLYGTNRFFRVTVEEVSYDEMSKEMEL